jgi:hypothetical protein
LIYRHDIIPVKQVRTGVRDRLDLEAICVFVTTGFFLDDSTYYKGLREHLPGSVTETDEQGRIISSEPWFKWHYSPRDISFKQALEEFTHLFERIVAEKGDNGYTIPISGGLDSRTLVAASRQAGKAFKGYSYAFSGGHDETSYGEAMARKLGFEFQSLYVEKGKLWHYIEHIAKRLECYSEFTHPRQFALHPELSRMGGTFLLGHWGDVLFDDMGIRDDIPDTELFALLWKKIVKPAGLELATRLWSAWGLQGNFEEYLRSELKRLFAQIDIREANPKLRAFKSLNWAPRWTVTNMQVFEDFGPTLSPYMDNRMCEFICTVPEKWLAGRQIQIEYLKMRSPELASVTWQNHQPFNLYNYKWNRLPYNLPYRGIRKLAKMLSGKGNIRRNWEIQFLGEDNDEKLRGMLFDNESFNQLVPGEVTSYFYKKFRGDEAVQASHAVSMLLTLSAFRKYVDPVTER